LYLTKEKMNTVTGIAMIGRTKDKPLGEEDMY
jgi:hypothetical protein